MLLLREDEIPAREDLNLLCVGFLKKKKSIASQMLPDTHKAKTLPADFERFIRN